MNILKKFAVPFFIVIVSVLVLIVAVYAVNVTKKNTPVLKKQATDISAFWEISKIEPNEGLFNLSVKSSSGQIRTYNGLTSFGLSSKGTKLAYYKEKQLLISNLDTDTATKINIELENIRVNIGETLHWDINDEYIAFTLVDLNANIVYLTTVNNTENKVILTQANIPYSNANLEEPFFSTTKKLLVVRTYNKDDVEYPKEDGSMFSAYELPIYLSTYDFNGNLTNGLLIADYSTNTYVKYGFDLKGRVKYFTDSKPLDEFISDEKYTKIQI